MLNIYIPSRSRSSSIYSMIQRIPTEYWPTTRVFVPFSQVEQYNRVINRRVAIIGLPDEYRMANVRKRMVEEAVSEALEYFLMIDDDVRFERRRNSEITNTVGCTLSETAECLQYIEKYLADGRWGQVGIQARQFQQGNPPGDRDEMFKEMTRNMCVTGWRTEDVLQIQYDRCVVRSDFDATLQLLRNGRPNINLTYWQHSQVNNAAGGCADYRTTEVANEAALFLQSLHPEFVSVVKKKYEAQARRSERNMGERLEVMIKWRKAYEWGLKNANHSSP